MLALLLGLLFSLGSINAVIPVLLILLLIIAAAGLNRGYSMLNFFGITTLAGINPGGKASIAGKSSLHLMTLIITPLSWGKIKPGGMLKARIQRRLGRAFARVALLHGALKDMRRSRKEGRGEVPQITGERGKAKTEVAQLGGNKGRSTFMERPTVAQLGGPRGGAKPGKAPAVASRATRAANRAKRRFNRIRKSKVAKILGHAALFGVNPLVGTVAVLMKSGSAMQKRRPYSANPNPRKGEPKGGMVDTTRLKQDSKKFGKDLLVPASPIGTATWKAFEGARGTARKWNDVKTQAAEEHSAILEGKGGGGLGAAKKAIHDRAEESGGNLSRRDMAGAIFGFGSLGREMNRNLDTVGSVKKRHDPNGQPGTGYAPGQRTAVGAVLAGTFNMGRAAFRGARAGGAGGAADAVAGRMRENMRNMGNQGTSLASARHLRSAMDTVALAMSGAHVRSMARSMREGTLADEVSIFDRVRTDRQKDHFFTTIENSVRSTKNTDRLDQWHDLLVRELGRYGPSGAGESEHGPNHVPQVGRRPEHAAAPQIGAEPEAARAAQLGEGPSARPGLDPGDAARIKDVLLAMAKNPRLSEVTAGKLASNDDPDIRAAVLRNGSLSEDDFNRNMKQEKWHFDDAARELAAIDRKMSRMDTSTAAGRASSDELREQANDAVDRMRNSSRMMLYMAGNPNATSADIETIRQRVTDNKDLNMYIINKTDKSGEKVASQATLTALANYSDPEVRKAARDELKNRFGIVLP